MTDRERIGLTLEVLCYRDLPPIDIESDLIIQPTWSNTSDLSELGDRFLGKLFP